MASCSPVSTWRRHRKRQVGITTSTTHTHGLLGNVRIVEGTSGGPADITLAANATISSLNQSLSGGTLALTGTGSISATAIRG